MATVFIPSLMQKLTGERHVVEVQGLTVRQVIDGLEATFPGTKARLVENNRIKPNISIAIDGEISTLGMIDRVGENSEVHFLPAIGGGVQNSRMPTLKFATQTDDIL